MLTFIFQNLLRLLEGLCWQSYSVYSGALWEGNLIAFVSVAFCLLKKQIFEKKEKLIMTFTTDDNNFFFFYFVYQTMFIINSAAPISFVNMFKRLGLSNTGKAVINTGINRLKNPV